MDNEMSGQSSASTPPEDIVGRTDQRQFGQAGYSGMPPPGQEYNQREQGQQQRGQRSSYQYDQGGGMQAEGGSYRTGSSSGRSFHGGGGGSGGGMQYDDEGNRQHWGRRGGWGFSPYYFDPFVGGLLAGYIMQAERGGNRQYDHGGGSRQAEYGGRTESGRFREGHSGRFGQGGSRQHEQPRYEPWPETFGHMGYPDVPFHPGVEFQPPQQYNPYPPVVYGGMPMRPYGRPGAMQHSGPMSMSPMNQLHFPMDPDEVDCMQAIFRKVLHAYEHYKLRGGNPQQLKRIVIDLEQN